MNSWILLRERIPQSRTPVSDGIPAYGVVEPRYIEV